MLIGEDDRRSRLETCRAAASAFLLHDDDARIIIGAQVDGIRATWNEICDEAELSAVDRAFLWERQFLNKYAFDG
jgi:serine/threonine-protein kinase HipA